MSLMAPNLPDFDIDEWRQRPYLDRIQALATHWAEHGFGTPSAVPLLYVFKIVGYAVGCAALIAATTPGIGGLGNVGTWWTEPIVLQKAVVFTLLFEVLGFGCASGPLTFRFLPPVQAPLFWLRPGTVRLPPWPGQLAWTRGTHRTMFDVALYASVLAAATFLLLQPGTDRAGTAGTLGLLAPAAVVPLALLVPLAGLRDKTIFLAARAEQYWVMALLFFFPYGDFIAGSKWVLVAIWWGAASSKLNHHFPNVVAVMMANAPLRPKAYKRAMFRDFPRDLRPSRLAFSLAHTGTLVEFSIPLVMLLGGGGTVTRVGVVIMVIFHLHIISTLPMGVPLEWNVFFVYATVLLFGHFGDVSPFSVSLPMAAFLLVGVAAMPVLGNLRPDLVSFLPAMRYYAGNWATTMWCFRDGAEEKMDGCITKSSRNVKDQLLQLYPEPVAELMMQKAVAWRSMHVHGRALNGLLTHAVEDVEAYNVREGEFVAGQVLGWNFGEGHLHNEPFIQAVQERCGYEPGEVRVIVLESQPALEQRQYYRIVDPAVGELERGHVEIADMMALQPWLDETGALPITVTSRNSPEDPVGGRAQLRA